jgi:hypothetical protein
MSAHQQFGRELGDTKFCGVFLKVRTYLHLYYTKGKIKLSLCSILRHEGERGVHVQIHLFLTLELVGVEWSASRLCRLTPGKEPPVLTKDEGAYAPKQIRTTLETGKFILTGYRPPILRSSSPQPVAIPTELSVLSRNEHGLRV